MLPSPDDDLELPDFLKISPEERARRRAALPPATENKSENRSSEPGVRRRFDDLPASAVTDPSTRLFLQKLEKEKLARQAARLAQLAERPPRPSAHEGQVRLSEIALRVPGLTPARQRRAVESRSIIHSRWWIDEIDVSRVVRALEEELEMRLQEDDVGVTENSETPATSPDAAVTVQVTDWKAMEGQQLVDAFNEMGSTATDLGLAFRSLEKFPSDAVGREACERLHRAIQRAAARTKETSMAKKAKTKTERAPRAPKVAKTKAPKAPKVAKTKSASANGVNGANGARVPKNGFRITAATEGKIRWKAGKDMPFRDGTNLRERAQMVKDCDGQTIQTYLKKAGKAPLLFVCIQRGLAEIVS